MLTPSKINVVEPPDARGLFIGNRSPDSTEQLRLLARSGELQRLVGEFALACGISFRLMVPSETTRPPCPGDDGTWIANPFCRRMRGSVHCGDMDALLARRIASNPSLQQMRCWAGIQHIAAPVLVAGIHVATLDGGLFALSNPSETDVLKIAVKTGIKPDRVRRMLLSIPVVSGDRMRALGNRVRALASEISITIQQMLGDREILEPAPVRNAKTFARRRLGDSISTRDAARHVHLNIQYFCALFRKTTGLTFVAWLTEVRLDRACEMLKDSNRKTVTEIAFESGFQSIPAFYSAFRRVYQSTPLEVRRRSMNGLRNEDPR